MTDNSPDKPRGLNADRFAARRVTRKGTLEPPSDIDPIDISQSQDTILSFLYSYSREPFQRELAKFLACAPDPVSVLAFAQRNPDRWSKAVQDLARIAGYTEKLEVDHKHTHYHNIQRLSDIQVEQRLAEIESLLKGDALVNEEVPSSNELEG